MSQRQELESLLIAIRSAPAMPEGSTLVDIRRAVETMMSSYPIAPGVAFVDDTLGGCATIRASAEAGDPARNVLLLHGGGYVMGSPKAYRSLSSAIASASGASVYAIDYRLAPEHPFPAALDDAVAAYRELLERGCDPEKLAFCGDSAGGGLVVATLVAARDAGLPLPVAAVLISPWVDMEMSGASIARNGVAEPILTNAGLADMAKAYLGGVTPPRDPRVSPIYADLHGLPPLMIQVGSHESLLDDALTLARKAAEADVRVRLEVRPQMFHGFHSRSGALQEAVETIAAVGEFLRDRLERGRSWECRA